MDALQHLEGLARKAMQTYDMVAPGDHVCVAVSGGKDSLALAAVLGRLRAYYDFPYTVQALTLDPCFGGVETDFSPVADFFAAVGIPYTIKRTDIGKVVFDERKEKNPCALCAKMRRGVLHTVAKELGCNKIALGHHLDDAVETFYMNLWGEGRIGCFSPVTWLSRRQITAIRPLVLAEERAVERAVRAAAFPVVKSRCPVDGATARTEMKAFVAQMSAQDPAFRQKTIGALEKSFVNGWKPAT